MAGALAEARLVDDRLGMLDADADRERLGLEEHASGVQHLERIAGAVAESHDDAVGFKGLAGREPKADNVLFAAVFLDDHIGHLSARSGSRRRAR